MSDSEQAVTPVSEQTHSETEPAWQVELRRAKHEADRELRRIHREAQERASKLEP